MMLALFGGHHEYQLEIYRFSWADYCIEFVTILERTVTDSTKL